MGNLKINLCGITDKEKQNAVWWLNELGFSTGFKSIYFYSYLYGCVGSQAPYDKTIQFGNSSKTFSRNTGKEITIPELRDLVVLKRNSIDDATHTDGHYSFYVGKDKNYFFSSCDKAWSGTWKNVDILKPIEKPMKEPKQAEFLVKTDSGYVLQVLDENAGGEDVVRVPDGADIAVKSNRGYIEFRKGKSFYAEEWCEGSWHVNDFPKHEWDIVWKRETLNDQVASAEVARQESKEWDLGDYDFAESDALIESNVEQSSIVKTLAERQSTYGDFSKVAEMTQGLLFVMSQYGYSDMPDTHKESIHMIASKLARIVNGDNNHLDSWHDIGGYSKLIENLIKSVND